MSDEIQIDWHEVGEKAGGYKPQAFAFVRDGLQHTVESVHGPGEPVDESDESRHVSGKQLCLGLRDYAVTRWGMLAPTVLGSWNVHSTEDFGRLVFAMIDAGVLRKTEQDTLEDFQGVFDFGEAFHEAELI